MAQTAEQAALTAAYLAQQRLIASTFSRDLLLLLRAVFSVNDPGQSWPASKLAMDALIRDRRRRSADSAARYYVQLRRASVGQPPARRPPRPAPGEPIRRVPQSEPQGSVNLDPSTGQLRPQPSTVPAPPAEVEQTGGATDDDLELDPLSSDDPWAELEKIAPLRPGEETELDRFSDLQPDRVEATLNSTGIASYKKALRAGQTPEQARDTMTTNLAGSATTLVLEGGRQLIHDTTLDDDEAIGWARITDPDPCAFCAMLASRGAVYRSRGTAGAEANKKFVGDGMFKFHNHDQCTARPIFDSEDPALEIADELYERWLAVTRGASGKKMIDAWAAYWNGLDPADKLTTHNAA